MQFGNVTVCAVLVGFGSLGGACTRASGERSVGGETGEPVAVREAVSEAAAPDVPPRREFVEAPTRARPELADRGTPAPICSPFAVDGTAVVVGTSFGIRRYMGPERWQLVAPTKGEPCGLLLDRGRVYWTEAGTRDNAFEDARVMVANLDGTDAKAIRADQHGPTGLAVGQSGIFWFECGTGTLWKVAEDDLAHAVASVGPDRFRYTHGCSDRGISADGGSVVWLHTVGVSYDLRLAYSTEDGSEYGEVVEFEHDYGMPRGVVLIGDAAYAVLYRATDDDPDAEILVKVAIPEGTVTTLWRGLPLFLARDGRRPVWGERDGTVYTERGGEVVKLGAVPVELRGRGHVLAQREVVWSDGRRVNRAPWLPTNAKQARRHR